VSASRLSIYNDALLMAGERPLSSLTESVETRRMLDQVWNNGGVNLCLEEAQWEFAMRTIRIDYDPGIEPDFGYRHAFDKPTDWIITSAFCSDEYFKVPILRYVDETGYWYCDYDTVYVRYVSNDANYGNDLSIWPRTFAEFVSAHFASKIILKLTNDQARLALFINPQNELHSIRGRALLKAKSKCAMSGPTQMPATGSWINARARGSNRWDGGNTSGNLTG